MSSRVGLEAVGPAQAALVAQVATEAARARDPHATAVGELEALERLTSPVNEVRAALLASASGSPVGVVSVETDFLARRQRVQLDSLPGSECLPAAFEFIEPLLRPAFALEFAVDAADEALRIALSALGYSRKRELRRLRLEFKQHPMPLPPLDSRLVPVASRADFEQCHAVQQSSFAGHPGFTPEPFERWLRRTVESPAFDASGLLLLRLGGNPIGFVEFTDRHRHRGSGYVHGIGVVPEFRARGWGQLLLDSALRASAEKGCSALELLVDCANSSGAQELYHKAGFEAVGSTELWESPKSLTIG